MESVMGGIEICTFFNQGSFDIRSMDEKLPAASVTAKIF